MGVTSIRDVGGAVGRRHRAAPHGGARRDPRAADGHRRPEHLHDRRPRQLDGRRGRRARGRARGRPGQIKAGATTIKVMSTGGMMTPGQRAGAPQLTVEEMTAAVRGGAQGGLPGRRARRERRGGPQRGPGRASIPWSTATALTAETIALMLDRGTRWTPRSCPTARSSRRRRRRASRRSSWTSACRSATALLDTLGDRVPHGRHDHGRQRRRRAARRHRGDGRGDLALYVRLGHAPANAIESATINTARLFRLDEVGYVEPGWVADLSRCVAATRSRTSPRYRRPEMVIKAGEPDGAAAAQAAAAGRA